MTTYPLPPWPSPLPSDPILAETSYGLIWLDPSDLIGRTLLGVQGDRDVREGRGRLGELPARADGHFWDGELLLPLYDECARPRMCVVIVGANFGHDALYCAQRGARVIAVEAQRDLHDLLWKTLEANPYTVRQLIHPLGWVAYDALGYFGQADYAPSNRGGMPFRRIEGVTYYNGGPLDPMISIMAAEHSITLLAIDAQGCDLRALKGLRQTIARHRPVIVFEFEQELAAAHGDDWPAHEAFIREIGYTMVESVTHTNNWIARPQ